MSTLSRFSTFTGAVLFTLSAPVAAFHGGGHGGGGGGGHGGGGHVGGGGVPGGGVRVRGTRRFNAPVWSIAANRRLAPREPCLAR